ncbi:MAG: ASKHA domain-containing protein [Thermoplasmata archaeon]
MPVTVRIEDIAVEIEKGQTLLDAVRKSGIRITSPCGGKGVCGKCLIRLVNATKEYPSTEAEKTLIEKEDIREGFRLACQIMPDEPVSISIPEESREMTPELLLKHAMVMPIEKPALTTSVIELPANPTKEIILDELEGYGPSARMGLFREDEYDDILSSGKIRLWFDGEQIVSVGSPAKRRFGAAIDIGSTTMVAYGFDILSQKIVSVQAMTNPQRQYGEDVMSRIEFSMRSPDKKRLLEKVVRNGIIEMLQRMTSEQGIASRDLLRIVVVGNTAMHHLFFGLDVTRLGRVPFQPETKERIEMSGTEIGLKGFESTRISAPPLIAGFVGADLVAVLLATNLIDSAGPTAVIDIGTNAEIALAANGRLLCCSSAAGPAFEGGNISHGMRATDGAICKVWSEGGLLKYETIGGSSPIGLCGSGLIDFVAEGLRLGLIDSSGSFVRENCGDRLLGRHGTARYVLYNEGRREISVSQADVRQLQLAKAAMHAGLEILMEKASVRSLERLLLAGAFGANMSIRNGRFIGMFPEIPLNRILPIGNAAGTGAIQLLTDMKARERVLGIARKAEHIELSLERDFQKRFISALDFPHQDPSKYPESFKSVRIKVERGK